MSDESCVFTDTHFAEPADVESSLYAMARLATHNLPQLRHDVGRLGAESINNINAAMRGAGANPNFPEEFSRVPGNLDVSNEVVSRTRTLARAGALGGEPRSRSRIQRNTDGTWGLVN